MSTSWFMRYEKPDISQLSGCWVAWARGTTLGYPDRCCFPVAPNQRKDSCVVQHAGLIRETVKSHKSYWVQTQALSMRCQQQSTAVRKQKAPVVWGIRRYGLRATGFKKTRLGVMLNSTRYLTTGVKWGLYRPRERSSLHAGDPNAHHTCKSSLEKCVSEQWTAMI